MIKYTNIVHVYTFIQLQYLINISTNAVKYSYKS